MSDFPSFEEDSMTGQKYELNTDVLDVADEFEGGGEYEGYEGYEGYEDNPDYYYDEGAGDDAPGIVNDFYYTIKRKAMKHLPPLLEQAPEALLHAAPWLAAAYFFFKDKEGITLKDLGELVSNAKSPGKTLNKMYNKLFTNYTGVFTRKSIKESFQTLRDTCNLSENESFSDEKLEDAFNETKIPGLLIFPIVVLNHFFTLNHSGAGPNPEISELSSQANTFLVILQKTNPRVSGVSADAGVSAVAGDEEQPKQKQFPDFFIEFFKRACMTKFNVLEQNFDENRINLFQQQIERLKSENETLQKRIEVTSQQMTAVHHVQQTAVAEEIKQAEEQAEAKIQEAHAASEAQRQAATKAQEQLKEATSKLNDIEQLKQSCQKERDAFLEQLSKQNTDFQKEKDAIIVTKGLALARAREAEGRAAEAEEKAAQAERRAASAELGSEQTRTELEKRDERVQSVERELAEAKAKLGVAEGRAGSAEAAVKLANAATTEVQRQLQQVQQQLAHEQSLATQLMGNLTAVLQGEHVYVTTVQGFYNSLKENSTFKSMVHELVQVLQKAQDSITTFQQELQTAHREKKEAVLNANGVLGEITASLTTEVLVSVPHLRFVQNKTRDALYTMVGKFISVLEANDLKFETEKREKTNAKTEVATLKEEKERLERQVVRLNADLSHKSLTESDQQKANNQELSTLREESEAAIREAKSKTRAAEQQADEKVSEANLAKREAEAATDREKEAKRAAEAAKRETEVERDTAIREKTTAETAKVAAEADKEREIAAKSTALQEKREAEAAREAAETAKAAALREKKDAEAAREAAETAKAAALREKEAAEAAREAADAEKKNAQKKVTTMKTYANTLTLFFKSENLLTIQDRVPLLPSERGFPIIREEFMPLRDSLMLMLKQGREAETAKAAAIQEKSEADAATAAALRRKSEAETERDTAIQNNRNAQAATLAAEAATLAALREKGNAQAATEAAEAKVRIMSEEVRRVTEQLNAIVRISAGMVIQGDYTHVQLMVNAIHEMLSRFSTQLAQEDRERNAEKQRIIEFLNNLDVNTELNADLVVPESELVTAINGMLARVRILKERVTAAVSEKQKLANQVHLYQHQNERILLLSKQVANLSAKEAIRNTKVYLNEFQLGLATFINTELERLYTIYFEVTLEDITKRHATIFNDILEMNTAIFKSYATQNLSYKQVPQLLDRMKARFESLESNQNRITQQLRQASDNDAVLNNQSCFVELFDLSKSVCIDLIVLYEELLQHEREVTIGDDTNLQYKDEYLARYQVGIFLLMLLELEADKYHVRLTIEDAICNYLEDKTGENSTSVQMEVLHVDATTGQTYEVVSYEYEISPRIKNALNVRLNIYSSNIVQFISTSFTQSFQQKPEFRKLMASHTVSQSSEIVPFAADDVIGKSGLKSIKNELVSRSRLPHKRNVKEVPMRSEESENVEKVEESEEVEEGEEEAKGEGGETPRKRGRGGSMAIVPFVPFGKLEAGFLTPTVKPGESAVKPRESVAAAVGHAFRDLFDAEVLEQMMADARTRGLLPANCRSNGESVLHLLASILEIHIVVATVIATTNTPTTYKTVKCYAGNCATNDDDDDTKPYVLVKADPQNMFSVVMNGRLTAFFTQDQLLDWLDEQDIHDCMASAICPCKFNTATLRELQLYLRDHIAQTQAKKHPQNE